MELYEERMDLECCKDCKFYRTEGFEEEDISYAEDFGECRRYPPKRIEANHSGFPMVDETWWCGEFVKANT